jgi:hypothetical protein
MDCVLVNLLRSGSGALEDKREQARDVGIVLDEHLVCDAERARTELDTLSQVISANLNRAFRSVYILTLKSFLPEASLPLSRKIEW